MHSFTNPIVLTAVEPLTTIIFSPASDDFSLNYNLFNFSFSETFFVCEGFRIFGTSCAPYVFKSHLVGSHLVSHAPPRSKGERKRKKEKKTEKRVSLMTDHISTRTNGAGLCIDNPRPAPSFLLAIVITAGPSWSRGGRDWWPKSECENCTSGNIDPAVVIFPGFLSFLFFFRLPLSHFHSPLRQQRSLDARWMFISGSV